MAVDLSPLVRLIAGAPVASANPLSALPYSRPNERAVWMVANYCDK